MHDESPEQGVEEYTLHGYERLNGYGLGEYESIGSVHEIALFIERAPEIGGALLSHFGGSLYDANGS